MKWHNIKLNEVLNNLNTNPETGLTNDEALKRIQEYGPNAFKESKQESLLQKILHHLKEISTIVLLIAAAISAYMAIVTGYGWIKVVVILSIVLINLILGITQESKAEKALDALKNLNAGQAHVRRGEVPVVLDARELVPGDVIELNAGDKVQADARLILSVGLKADEASLTGESVPVDKEVTDELSENALLGDRINMVYSGTLVTGGRGVAVVTDTGMQTEMGKVAALLNSVGKQLTPLQKRLKTLNKYLTAIAILAGVIMFVVGVFLHGDSLGELLLTTISLAVAAVPETLPVIVTLILAGGVASMVRKNTIIRRIAAVETVGNTSVIASDKTGTLTQNKMTVMNVWCVGEDTHTSGRLHTEQERQMLSMFAACTNVSVSEEAEEAEEASQSEQKLIGDPTEIAIIRMLLKQDMSTADVEEIYPRVHEIPFDSERKLMTTVHKYGDGYLSITKGAFDRIPVHYDEKTKAEARRMHDDFAKEALRVLALGVKRWDSLPQDLSEEVLEKDLTLVGLIGMIDPPRPESKRAVREAKLAGIRTVMITGDHIDTASKIAEEIGILEEGGRAISSVELAAMDDEELYNSVQDISVYARVSPEDKIRIVKAWQHQGDVITMTGDGVNDAPALKAANVGAAMGITGTEVAKNASDMIITDDNFATIVDAVSEGRLAYDNIKKTVHFLLSVNFAEIVVMLLGTLIGWGTPISSIHLLFINVISDGIPGFFISKEKAEEDIMRRKPISPKSSLFANGLGVHIAIKSAIFVVLTMAAFYIGRFVHIGSTEPTYATGITMAFLVLSWASVLNIFNVRSTESIFKVSLLSNPHLLLSAGASLLISALAVLLPPLRGALGLSSLGLTHWMAAIGLALLQLVAGEIIKAITRFKNRIVGNPHIAVDLK